MTGASAQETSGTSPQLYLIPQSAANNNIVLEAHIANLRLFDDPNAPGVSLDGTYRLRNPASQAATVPLRLYPGGDQSLGAPQGVSLTQGDQVIGLMPDGNGGYTGEVSIPASSSITLRLRYQSSLGSAPLATFRYAPAILNQWSGNVSLRVEVRVPAGIPPESWLLTAPDSWRYTYTAEAGVLGLHWLYDFTIPDTPMRIQFVTPRVWAELQSAESAAQGDAPVATFVQLGGRYRELMAAATGDAVRSRFYAQAVAAYSAGLASRGVLLAPPTERAGLHIGLADLYRRRIVDVPIADQPQYSELMAAETAAALALLPEDDARRAELIHWRADGLQVLLTQARNRRDWPAALALIEAMAALPGAPVATELIDEQRRFVLVQQALQLMEQGNREAALAVAGNHLDADALTPSAQALSLFTGWQISVTVTPELVRLRADAATTHDRAATAHAALDDVVRSWQQGAAQGTATQQQYRFTLHAPVSQTAQTTVIGLEMEFPPQATGVLPARMLPPRPDYALLQTLLMQLAPTEDRRRGLFFEQLTMRQPMNLSAAATQWQTVAAGLESQADSFEAAGSAVNASDPAGAAAALQSRVQAVTYRAAAAEWRALVRQSRLLYQFSADEPAFARLTGDTPSRAWTVTVAAPAQTFVFQTQVLSLSRVLVAGLLGLVALLGISGLLWSLL